MTWPFYGVLIMYLLGVVLHVDILVDDWEEDEFAEENYAEYKQSFLFILVWPFVAMLVLAAFIILSVEDMIWKDKGDKE